MYEFAVKINIPSLTTYSQKLGYKVPPKELLAMVREFSLEIREIYLALVSEQVNSPRYKGNWEPTDLKYQEYLGVKPTGGLLKLFASSLKGIKTTSNYYVTVDPHLKYPRSKLTLLKVLNAIEYGTSKFTARPILKRVIRTLQKHISDLWKGFLTTKGVI